MNLTIEAVPLYELSQVKKRRRISWRVTSNALGDGGFFDERRGKNAPHRSLWARIECLILSAAIDRDA